MKMKTTIPCTILNLKKTLAESANNIIPAEITFSDGNIIKGTFTGNVFIEKETEKP